MIIVNKSKGRRHFACGLFCIKATEKLFARIVKARIDCVEIFAVHILLDHPQRFTETLEVSNLSLTQELDRFPHIGDIYQAQDIVIGEAGFLFCCNGVRTAFLEAVIFIVQAAFK